MLSRTADSLFWLSRYVERAENMARLVEMGRRIRATPGVDGALVDPWPTILAAAGCAQDVAPLAAEDADDALDDRQWRAMMFLMLDRENPSSVVSCIEQARANARAVRAALTVEMWEAINEAWIELRALSPNRIENGAMSPLLDWVKQRGAMLRGATDSTALRNDGYEFMRLGCYIERLDSTARLVDVLSGGLAQSAASNGAAAGTPTPGAAGVGEDLYAWVAILRAAGVLRAYHAAYSADYQPRRILDFLVLNPTCPRSLAHSAERISFHLDCLARLYGRRDACHMGAGAINALLAESTADGIAGEQLHGFLSDVIRRNNRLALSIASAYHFAPAPLVEETAAPEPAVEVQASQTQSQSQISATPPRRAVASPLAPSALRDLAVG